ncbi:MFS transporter [Jannaschia sp. W003]|uniref:MFS transporter n=1 Tax=Jannaschia sp. W003 TaxID=2867012 RepID=UPI0021A3CB4B|nr:MFS transporter [Jannaschia sp. W003]UWQ22387.1 MFS transporter [Jannaschia sp. W003]
MGDLRPAGPQPAVPAARGWIGLVAAVTALQAVLSLLVRVPPLFGLPLTAAAGMPPEAVGQLAAATSAGSMAFFLWGPTLLPGMGPMAQLRIGCVVAAVALVACLSGVWLPMLLAAFVIGLGYGPSTPAGSEILMRAVPRGRRATIFSVKQAGVPLGGVIAGALLPPVALHLGGVSAAVLVAAAVAVGVALLLVRHRDPTRPSARRIPNGAALLRAPVELQQLIVRTPRLRRLALAGLGLGAAQGVTLSYFPVYLSDAAGWSIAAAGLAFAVLQAAGIPGRIAVGWLADRGGDAEGALGWLAAASAATMLALATFGPASPDWWVLLVAAVAGLTVVSWNGVFLLSLAEAAPEGRVGESTAGGTFVLFAGYVVSPIAAQAVFVLTGGYTGVFVATALAPAMAALLTLRRPRPDFRR